MPSGSRIKILSPDEIDLLYGIPKLDNEDRKVLFDLAETDRHFLTTLSKHDEKINYILQLGFFRAKNCFFNFTFQQVRDDVWFIINQ